MESVSRMNSERPGVFAHGRFAVFSRRLFTGRFRHERPIGLGVP